MTTVEIKTPWVGKELIDHANRNKEKDGSNLELKINPEFEKLIPPQSRGEEMDLQRSLRNEGCRDALVIWDGTIIDGHNRYKYCKEKGIAFRVIERHFKDEATAKVWIIDNQLARRNLTKEAKIRLESKRKDILSDEAEKRMKAGKRGERDAQFLEALDNNENNGVDPKEIFPEGQVRDQIGESAGVSGKTVEKFHYIEKHDPERADALCRGKYDKHGNRITTNSVYNDLKEKERKEELIKQGLPIGRYAIAYVSDIDAERSKLLDLKEFMKDDALIFIWSSVWSLQKKTALLNELGFEHTDMMMWDFVNSCNSAYVDNHHMYLLIGKRGEPSKYFLPVNDTLPSIVKKPRSGDLNNSIGIDGPIPPHEEFKALIHQKYPDVKKLDYFGSQVMDGWETYSFRKPPTYRRNGTCVIEKQNKKKKTDSATK